MLQKKSLKAVLGKQLRKFHYNFQYMRTLKYLQKKSQHEHDSNLSSSSRRNQSSQDKEKRKVDDTIEGEKSFKMKVDPILMQATMAVKAKRKQRIHRLEMRKRGKHNLQEVEWRVLKVEQELKEEREHKEDQKEEEE